VLQVDAGGGAFTVANSLSTYTSYPDTPNTVAYAGGACTDCTVYENLNANCVRFHIYFASTPGDLNELVVDTSGVTVVNQDTSVAENTDQGATSVGHRSTDLRKLGDVNSVFISDGFVLTCTGADAANTCSTDGTNEITIGSGVVHRVHTYDRIKLECGSKKIGTYTVSVGTAPTTTTITTDEVIPACVGDASNKLKISVMTNTIWVDADLTGMGLVGSYVRVGSDTVGPVTATYWQPGVSELVKNVAYDADLAGQPFQGRLIIGGALPTGHTTFNANTAISENGKGQSEKTECSDRGVCEPETGLCNCFSGYTGLACEKQNALSA